MSTFAPSSAINGRMATIAAILNRAERIKQWEATANETQSSMGQTDLYTSTAMNSPVAPSIRQSLTAMAISCSAMIPPRIVHRRDEQPKQSLCPSMVPMTEVSHDVRHFSF